MGAIADLAVPQGGAIAALPNPTQAVSPEDLDVGNFNATAGPVRQGLRSGMNTLGANMNALIGQTGEVLGLTEFANDRFQDAKNYVDFADRVGSPVRDWGQVKDAEQLSKFVGGMLGEAAATSLPAVGAAVGLRRPIAGITAGTLPFSAGQQIQRERANPKAGDTPGSVLAHGLEKGVVDSGLYASLGGVGQGVRKILNPKTAAKGSMTGAVAEGALGNAAVGAASSASGDVIAGDQPNWDTALSAAIGNAVPGAILSGAGHAVGALPGAAARSTDELRTRLGKKTPPPAAEPRLEDLRDDMTVDDIASLLKDHEDRGGAYATDVWNKVKDHPAAQKFGDVLTDPAAREAFMGEVKQKYSDSEYKPKIDAALTTGKKWIAGAQKYIENRRGTEPETKNSEMRTSVDDDIHDAMLAAMPIDHLEAAKPEQLLELGGVIKKMAENPDYFAETGVPHALRQAFGPAFKGLMETAVDRVHSPGPARTEAKKKIADVFAQHENVEGLQTEEVQNLVRTHMKPEYLAKPEMRKAALEELAPQLLDYVNREGKTAPAAQFHDAMKEAFGDKTDKVLAGLDRMHEESVRSHVFDQGVEEKGPAADQRLNKKYDYVEDAEKAREDLIKEYGQKNVTIDKRQNPDGSISLHLEPADQMGLDKDAFNRSREPAKYNRSGIENGVLTVKTGEKPGGVKINLVNLTSEMMRREGQLTQDTGPKYIADMFKRGIAALMASDDFHGFTEKGGLKDGTFPDSTPVAHLRGKTFTFGEIKDIGKLSKMDIAGFTRENLVERMQDIAAKRDARGWKPLAHAVLRKAATDELIKRERSQEMAKTLADRMEMESEEQMVESAPTLRDRDPKDKKGEMIPRTYEEKTGLPIGEGGASTKAGPETPAPSEPPHGEGPMSKKALKAVQQTTDVMNALNTANPKVAKAIEELRKPISKFSTMNIAKGLQTEEQRQAVRDYVKKVLGDKQTEVLFEKMKKAGDFAKLDGTETLRISIDASDPMSVGHHEAVHAFMARLMNADPKAAHTLMRAAGAAPIVARLRELLADHPAALKQLADPEERVAYMYQFWASGHKGLLSIGPNTRTFFDKAKGFFAKIQAIWADDMGTSAATERTNDLILAFHNGEFANRSTVAQVLTKRFPPDPEANLRKFWPGLGKFMDHVIYTANGGVRDMNVPAFTEVMDKFHTLQSDTSKPTGFNQVRRVVYNKFLNRVIDVVKDMDDSQQAALLEELQSGKPRTSEGAKAIEQLNKELFDYMTDKGVKVWAGQGEYKPLQEIKENYWHRVPNQEYLRTADGKAGFIALLEKHGIKAPEDVYNKWVRDVDSGLPQEGDAVLGLSFYTPQINERKLQMIPDGDIAPYLSKDLFGTMSQYIQRAVRRAEYTDRFGNRGEVIDAARKTAEKQGATADQLKVFDSAVQAHEGTLGANMSPKLRSTYAALMTYQNIRLLPLQLFSSFVDPLGIMVRGGTLNDAFKGFTRGLRELVGVKQDDGYDMAKTIGSISTAFDQGLASDMVNSQFMPKLAKTINDKFFKYNGMESWNRSLRIAATTAAHDFIVRHVEAPNKHSERMLAEMDLTAKDVKVTDGQLDLHDPKIQDAMNRWVNEAILTPNAAHRPIYMSDPHYMLISHLKQYSYLFQKVILSRVHNEMKNGNYSPAYALAGYVPAIIAADMMRIAITPTPNDDAARAGWTAKDWLWSGIQRAGFFGPGQMAVGTAMDARQDRLPGQNLLGPTFEQGVDVVRDIAQGTGLKNELVNAVPGLKLFKGTGRETTPVGDE